MYLIYFQRGYSLRTCFLSLVGCCGETDISFILTITLLTLSIRANIAGRTTALKIYKASVTKLLSPSR